MARTRRTWVIFVVCVAPVAAALGWVTFVSLRLERGEFEARAEAQFQESLRLALWRMDSLLTPLIAQEAARPYSQYAAGQSFDPLSNLAIPATQAADGPGGLVSAEYAGEFFRIHFQVGPDGVITSPEALGPSPPSATFVSHVNEGSRAAARDAVAQLRQIVTREEMLKELARAEPNGPAELVVARRAGPSPKTIAQWTQEDFTARQQMTNIAQNAFQNQIGPPGDGGEVAVRQSGLVPMWCAGAGTGRVELLFIRSVTIGESRTVQGIWMHWPRLEKWLLDAVRDVLPNAKLEPALTDRPYPPGRMLASIPAVVEAAPAAAMSEQGVLRLTPTRITLLTAWAAAVAAVIAVGLVLRATIELGERRLQFASAVTHELRTPLTTFRMYSEMLSAGMLPDEKSRREYLATLSREADRLSQLVENVLLYARVEQRRAATRCERLAAVDLIERVRERPGRRAADAGMELVIDAGGVNEAIVATDCQAVEQILYNLVDNSCKYARSAEDRRLHVRASARDGALELLYRDHGPGIPPSDEKRVFEAFRRGSRDAASPAPGVGLGLALARGLARELGGELRIVRLNEAGAGFLLTLPLQR